MTHLPPVLPAWRAPAHPRKPTAARRPAYSSANGVVNTWGVVWTKQPDGTWQCLLPNGTESVDGADYRIEVRMVPVNPGPTPTPAPVPNPTPAPVPSAALYGVTGPFGGSVRSGTAGQTVVIQGTNLGTGGQIRFGAVPAVVLKWTATAVTVTLPAPLAPATLLVGKVQAVLASGAVVTTVFDFAVGPAAMGSRSW